ncbi:MAG: hypothetical protein Sylvanvirus6_20 [Sylvanvirus sp.]|uniref:Uncharacterized protein n=1 Tax=Sylvanvirus sp. TaxID=2487774 RepID=A0A3G5AL45_9VIRU|nr:MAG: hypothetical protein Sylvanvirus6_20 [Sylvanvirus sp.]
MPTLSFAILDDLEPYSSDHPIHMDIPNLDYSTVHDAVKKMVENLESDPTNVLIDYEKSSQFHSFSLLSPLNSCNAYAVDTSNAVSVLSLDLLSSSVKSKKIILLRDDIKEVCKNITGSLIDKHYFVANRRNKYYVMCFALNYTRFDVFSKDCPKQLMVWRNNDQDDPIEGVLSDEDNDQNPVITTLKQVDERIEINIQ